MNKSMDQMAENSRQQLAKERDTAIERLSRSMEQNKAIAKAYQNMQKDMVRWVMSFMLLTNNRSLTVDTGTLKDTEGFVLTRENNPDEGTITWAMITREENDKAEAEKEERISLAEKLQAEVAKHQRDEVIANEAAAAAKTDELELDENEE